MRTLDIRPYRLSDHARTRLIERTTVSEHDLFRLLQQRAYLHIHSKYVPTLSQSEIDFLKNSYGLSFKELKEYGIVQVREEFRHLLIWSSSDQQPFTLIVSSKDSKILTVLHSDDFTKHDWSDIVTFKSVAEVQRKTEQVFNSILGHETGSGLYELHARWLDSEGIPKRKTFSNPKIVSVSPLTPAIDELEKHVRVYAGKCRELLLIVRKKKDHSIVKVEKHLE